MARSADLRFRAGEIELAATLTLPDIGDRVPWVLLVPSWLPRDRSGGWDRVAHPAWFAEASDGEGIGLLARLADALAQRGIASLRWDKRGCGLSGGDWGASDLFTLVDDVRDALGAMRGRPELDLRRTGIVGHGEGAGIALSVAIGDPAISALTLIGAAARSWRDVLRRGVAERGRSGVDRQHPLVASLDRSAEELLERAERRELAADVGVAGERMRLNLAAWEQAIHTPSIALATMLHRSVTLVHGDADAWTNPDESRLLADALRSAGNEPRLDVVPGAGHDLAGIADERIGAIAGDLADRIEARELPPVLQAIEEMADGAER